MSIAHIIAAFCTSGWSAVSSVSGAQQSIIAHSPLTRLLSDISKHIAVVKNIIYNNYRLIIFRKNFCIHELLSVRYNIFHCPVVNSELIINKLSLMSNIFNEVF